MKVLLYLFSACMTMTAVFSCTAKIDVKDRGDNNENAVDNVAYGGEPEVFYTVSPYIYSSKMKSIVESILWKNVIELNNGLDSISPLEPVYDMEYLPYLYLCASSPLDRESLEINSFFGALYLYICSSMIDDKKLFEVGKQFINEINQAHKDKHFEDYTKRNETTENRMIRKDWEYPDSFGGKIHASLFSFPPERELQLTYVDTLRVRVVIHNDRNALTKLEQYYSNKNDKKGLAIYYKVMLGYKGNGDLAERFYKVLAPELDRNPQLKRTVREVLLRAALCDKNKRAKELCDSLGFSLCDYRLPKLDN